MSENCGIMENLKVPPPCLPDRPLGEQETFPVIGGAQGDNAVTNTLVVKKAIINYGTIKRQSTAHFLGLTNTCSFILMYIYECIFTMS